MPEGFRDRLTRANIQGMRVLWFERDGPQVRPPAVLSAALGRLRRHPRSGDARRLVARRRHRRAALARPPDPGQGRRGDRPPARGEARPHRRPCRRRPDRLGPERRRAAHRRHRRRRPCAHRPRRLDPRSRPVRRSRRRRRPDQPARNRPRAAQLAPQGRPRRRRRLRRPPRAGDPRGAGQGADVSARFDNLRGSRDPAPRPAPTRGGGCASAID